MNDLSDRAEIERANRIEKPLECYRARAMGDRKAVLGLRTMSKTDSGDLGSRFKLAPDDLMKIEGL
jgi:hypothetical protein